MRSTVAGAYAFRAAGISLALWVLVHPWNQLMGAHAGQSTSWAVSHTFHFLAGLFACAGLVFLYATRRDALATPFGAVAFWIAFVGSALFTGTGMFTAFLWPVLARNAPQLVEASGPFFSPPHPLIIITGALLSAGFILLAITLYRRAALSKFAAAALVLGFVMMLAPPPPLSPLPWIFGVTGGVIAGIGLFALGGSLNAADRALRSTQEKSAAWA